MKTLAKIKQTLQAYAIARPAIRLSLKVLKAKSDKSNWMYAPKIGASVPDAAMKVVDKTVAGQCQWISWDASVKSNLISDGLAEVEDAEEDQMDKSSYRVEAFLPRINAGMCYSISIGLKCSLLLPRAFDHQPCWPIRLDRLEASVMYTWHSKAADRALQELHSFGLSEASRRTLESVSLFEYCVSGWQLRCQRRAS